VHGGQLAVRLLFERLSPIERAVYILREAFDYPFREIAEALDISGTNARQLACRARTHFSKQRRDPVDPTDLLEAFLRAAQSGEMARLKGLLADGTALSGTGPKCGRR
jgi:RNA polymerase sigma-70 factor (ECF subfamily)